MRSALIDRARVVVVSEPTGAKVEGTSLSEPAIGDWFPARLVEPAAPETEAPGDPQGRRTVAPAQLLVGRVGPLVAADQRVEVRTGFGEDGEVWEVAGVERLRRRTGIIGQVVQLRRVLPP